MMNKQRESKMSYTFDEQSVSDLHKDASGHRPGDGFWQMWSTASDDTKQTIWDGLLTDLEYSISSEKEADRQAAAAFESLVTKTIEMGAGDRETAIRWLFEGCEDLESALWDRGLLFVENGKYEQEVKEIFNV